MMCMVTEYMSHCHCEF